MPPKPSEGKSSSESSKKKTKSQSFYTDQRLYEISVARARVIASKLGIHNPGKHVKDALILLIREKLALVADCTECGGGPCIPDEHIFLASDPNSGQGSASGGDESDSSRTDDSPSREHLKSLNRVQHHSDAIVPGFESCTTFVSHITNQFHTEEPPQGPSSLPPEYPFSPAPAKVVLSSDDEELGPELAAGATRPRV